MLPVSSSSTFYLYNGPADMRKSFDGLCGLVSTQMKADVLNGSVYLFINRRRDRIKMLVWDPNGFWLIYKRLEQGRLQWPKSKSGEQSIEISYELLVMLIEGVDINYIRRKKRYKRPNIFALNS